MKSTLHSLLMTLLLTVLAAGAGFGQDEITSETAYRVSSALQNAYGTHDRLAKRKASRRHDRVTIVVSKSSDAKLEATTELSKESSIVSTLNKWFTLKLDRDGNLVANPRTGPQQPEVDLSLSREHQGEGETERINTITNKISGEVMDVLPNGQMIVAARTQILVAGEEEMVELTGRVDPQDLTPDSTINAEQIIDLRYRVEGKGAVTDSTKRGWGARLIDKFNPF